MLHLKYIEKRSIPNIDERIIISKKNTCHKIYILAKAVITSLHIRFQFHRKKKCKNYCKELTYFVQIS